MSTSSNIQNTWKTLLMHVELAKNYKMANMIAGLGQPPAPNPILETLLPSLLLVRLGALVDETFEEYITSNSMVMDRSYRNDFNGKIKFLNDEGRLNDATGLHNLRLKRNELAHEASRSCTWADLEGAIGIVDAEFQYLGLIGPRPKYEFYAERTPRPQTNPGYALTFDHCYGLKVEGRKAIEVSWTVNYE
jgi:hypothetical protein